VALFLVRSGADIHRQNREHKCPPELADPELRRKLEQAYALRN
jgi:hypothetical protein